MIPNHASRSSTDEPATKTAPRGRTIARRARDGGRRQKNVRSLRLYRKLHRRVGAILFATFFVVSASGLLLGWKKHSGGTLLPTTEKGVSTDVATWLSFDSLHTVALGVLRDSIGADLSPELERIDARPDKGTVKFVFLKHYNEVQLDGTTGAVLAVNRRTHDLIENIHDGSILDFAFDTDDEQFKLVYTSIMGSALLFLSLSGAWLWLGPRKLRRGSRMEDRG